MAPEEILDKVARSKELIEFATTPGRAFVLISQLQLALRLPENNGPSTEIVREMIANMAQAIPLRGHSMNATTTDTPEVLEIIATGDHPEFDLTREEADEYFGQQPMPERRLTLSLDLAEDCDTQEIGLALIVLMQQTPDPEATYRQLREALIKANIDPIFPA